MHYCIGDVHGCYDELMHMLKRIEEQDDDARIILLGDLMDRGNKSYEVIKWAMENVTEDGKYQCLMGNHEDLVLQWYKFKYLHWLRQEHAEGEIPPRSKFDFAAMCEEHGLMSVEALEPMMHFFEARPLHKILNITDSKGCEKEFVLVHAWHRKGIRIPVVLQKMNLRMREFKGNPDPSYTVVFGHTPTGNDRFLEECKTQVTPGKIAHLKGAINLDGGCCFGQSEGYQGHLCGLCLETGEEFYEVSKQD